VRGQHDGQVGVAGAVPGGVGAGQVLRGHRFPSVVFVSRARVSSPVVVMVMIPSYVLVVLSDEIRLGGVTASLMLRKTIILIS
jgi:hypothetical protein